jgi:hypothetical protein
MRVSDAVSGDAPSAMVISPPARSFPTSIYGVDIHISHFHKFLKHSKVVMPSSINKYLALVGERRFAEGVDFVAARELGDGFPTHWACARANALLVTPRRYAFFMKRVVIATVDEAIRSFCLTNRALVVHLKG